MDVGRQPANECKIIKPINTATMKRRIAMLVQMQPRLISDDSDLSNGTLLRRSGRKSLRIVASETVPVRISRRVELRMISESRSVMYGRVSGVGRLEEGP